MTYRLPAMPCGLPADAFHTGFQIRAEVNPGDEEYVLVVAVTDATQGPTINYQFHGAIVTNDATSTQKQRQRTLNTGDSHTIPITVTAPGLLTVETTGSTDTSGMLSATVTAEDDSSGSGNNFKIVAPVPAAAYIVTVDGQTPSTTGAYTLDMDFQVAMQTGLTAPTGATVPTAPTWTSTGISADDSDVDNDDATVTVQIQPSADEDYFLITISDNNSGFLTIEADGRHHVSQRRVHHRDILRPNRRAGEGHEQRSRFEPFQDQSAGRGGDSVSGEGHRDDRGLPTEHDARQDGNGYGWG